MDAMAKKHEDELHPEHVKEIKRRHKDGHKPIKKTVEEVFKGL